MTNDKSAALWDEWDKETAKRRKLGSPFACKNLKELEKRVSDKKTMGVILEITDRIVQRFKPQKVMLFGSRARGGAKSGSDIDLMVIFKNNVKPLRKFLDIKYHVTDKSPITADILVTSRKKLRDECDSYGLAYYYAIRDGFLLYADDNSDALALLGRARRCFKSCIDHAKSDSFQKWAGKDSYLATKMALQSTFIAENMPYPDTGDLNEIKAMMSDWEAKNIHMDLSCITALRWKSGKPMPVFTNAEIKKAVSITTDIFKSIENEFKTRGIA